MPRMSQVFGYKPCLVAFHDGANGAFFELEFGRQVWRFCVLRRLYGWHNLSFSEAWRAMDMRRLAARLAFRPVWIGNHFPIVLRA